jgi:uncharacterized hydrophobic protein (TIGR00271 family)
MTDDPGFPASIEVLDPQEDALFRTSAISANTTSARSSVVNSEVITTQRHDPLQSQGAVRSVGLKDLPKIFRTSTAFTSVSHEQIERVRNMHDKFTEGSQFSFNYNTLLVVASVLAGLGLASNSSTMIISSMLVSPIMGPVVGMAYGATIQDWRLFWTAFRTELLSLLVCVIMGLLLGLATGATGLGETWPTSEMVVRATWTNFLVALPVAFFSGLGVAVGLLDEQTSSLVGVAISASLLPPAVNAGILWVAYGFYQSNLLGHGVGDGGVLPEEVVAYVQPIIRQDVERHQFRQGGFISLALTIANVLIIIGSSMLMFRLKEVSLGLGGYVVVVLYAFESHVGLYAFVCFLQRLPIKKKIFWEDLGVARKIYRHLAIMSNDEEPEENMNTIIAEEPETEDEENMNTIIAEEPETEDEGKEEERSEEKAL